MTLPDRWAVHVSETPLDNTGVRFVSSEAIAFSVGSEDAVVIRADGTLQARNVEVRNLEVRNLEVRNLEVRNLEVRGNIVAHGDITSRAGMVSVDEGILAGAAVVASLLLAAAMLVLRKARRVLNEVRAVARGARVGP